MLEFYVYIYFLLSGVPCYVGKGKGRRWRVHKTGNTRLSRTIKKYGQLPVVILRVGLSEDEAFATEIAFIKAIGRGKNGPLFNLTDGGDGTSGLVLSEERKAAISAVHKGKIISDTHKAIVSAASASRVWAQSSRDKIRAKKLGLKRPDIDNMRVVALKQWASPKGVAARAALAASNRKRVWTPEMRAKQRKTMTDLWKENHPC